MKYLILGCGETGIFAAKFLLSKKNDVVIFDENINRVLELKSTMLYSDLSFASSIQELSMIGNIEKCIVSPGFRTIFNKPKIAEYCISNNIEMISDIDLMIDEAEKYSTKVIGITGTNGKTTTTKLLEFTLNRLGKKAIACGNIGNGALGVDFGNRYDYFVVEMSSAQLEIMKNPRFYAGLLLNISDDHIDYHGSIQAYQSAKEKIFSGNMVSLLAYDIQLIKDIEGKKMIIDTVKTEAGISFENESFYYNGEKLEFETGKIGLIGDHNITNILFVANFCISEGFDVFDVLSIITEFKPLKHRVQLVRKIGNIVFINDSKGTNIHATKTAISSLNDVYLIAGGIEKYENSVLDLSDNFNRIRHFFLIGKDALKIAKNLKENQFTLCENMNQAVRFAYKMSISDMKNKVSISPNILLSPFCASMDMYKNYEHRGDDFIDCVNGL